jgi:hypothetical protein
MDNFVWTYRCRVEGNRVVWASEPGRWRDGPKDDEIFFELSTPAGNFALSRTTATVRSRNSCSIAMRFYENGHQARQSAVGHTNSRDAAIWTDRRNAVVFIQPVHKTRRDQGE